MYCRADLHIHSLLSPCGSLEMSPANIIKAALDAKLDIIGITDHNSTKQAPLIKKMGKKQGLFVLCGSEVNSAEEVHCLTLFENNEQLSTFQFFIDQHILPFPNNTDLFGDQIVVDEQEMIIEEIENLLINALDVGLIEIEQKVHQLGGIVIPAHIDRPYNGLFSQLGFIPETLKADAFEISKNAKKADWVISGKLPKGSTLLRSSDAHIPSHIGNAFTIFKLEKINFQEIKMAIQNQNGRETRID